MFRRTLLVLLLVLMAAVACRSAQTAVPPAASPTPPSEAAVPSTPLPPTATPEPAAPVATEPPAAPTVAAPSEWVFHTSGEVFSSAALSEDGATVYVGSMDYDVYALDAATGAERWRFETGDQVVSSPAVAGGLVYVGSLDGNLYALDEATGEVRWQAPLGFVIASPTVADGAVVVGAFTINQENGAYTADVAAFDAASGEMRWQTAVTAPQVSSAAVVDGVVYVGDGDGLLALDAASGEILWEAPAGVPVQSSPVVDDTTVYVGSNDGHLYAVDRQTGEVRWGFEGGGEVVSSPELAGGRLYVGDGSGVLYALDPATGEEIWRLSALVNVVSSPLAADGVVYVGASNGRVYAVDAETGAFEWFYPTGDVVWASPLVDDERLYIGSFDRNFYALDRDGPALTAAAVPQPTPLAPQPTPVPPPAAPTLASDNELPWWNDRVFYEVFVRSFSDSDGDGIGDLQGLIDKLDYLNDGDPATTDDLGVTGIWLMPIAQSPSYHGYDVTDYYTVEEDYGTNEDFLRLLDEAHKRGIAVIVDLVLNHTSNQHPWFAESRRPGGPRETWYIWDATPSFWLNPWGGVAWHQDGLRYYYGMFWQGMPDLNYRNGDVTVAMQDVIRYWLEDMPADGFRLDAIRHLIEDGDVQANTPETHAWLKSFYNYVHDINPDALTIGEVWDTTDAIAPYVGDEVNLAFEFNVSEGILNGLILRNNTSIYKAWRAVLDQYPDGQYAPFLTNHDQNRVMNRLRGDEEAAKAAAGLLLTSPGIPFIYYGEEIGMSGEKPDEQIRTPMQWGVDEAGNPTFTTGTPWEPLQDDWDTRTVDAQAADPDSLLNHYRALIGLRNAHPALLTGSMALVDSSSPRVASYLRQEGDERLLVIVNLDREPISDYRLSAEGLDLPAVGSAEVIFGTGAAVPPTVQDGGFSDYTPLPELPARSTTVISLAP